MQQQQHYQNPNYPYYAQPMYPQPTPGANPYIPFNYPPHPAPHIPPGPVPAGFDAAAYTSHQHQPIPMPRAKNHHRSNTTPARNTVPLKSAMKRAGTTPVAPADEPLPRERKHSFQRPPVPVAFPRPRKYSNSGHPNDYRSEAIPVTPVHMFVSFHGFNELHLENITEPALKELRSSLWPLWPDGVESDVLVNAYTAHVKFKNTPWDMGAVKAPSALKFILGFWELCARRGYTFQTTIDTATPAPRLIFQATYPEESREFFVAYLSQGGRRLTLVNPPQSIEYTLGAQLKAVLGRQVADELVGENIRVIEIKRAPGFGVGIEPSQFLMHVLRIISDLQFELDAAVSLGRKGPLGIRSRRELLIFKSNSYVNMN